MSKLNFLKTKQTPMGKAEPIKKQVKYSQAELNEVEDLPQENWLLEI